MSASTDDFEQVIVATRDAAAAYLDSRPTSSLLARYIAEDVDEHPRTVGMALARLEERGEVKPVTASTPRRWTLVDGETETEDGDGGGDDA